VIEPIIQVIDVSKWFINRQGRTLRETLMGWRKERGPGGARVWALRNISFNVGKGETLGIIGPNGSGKSTLLKILAGVLKPSQGSVILRGQSLALLELGAGFRSDLTGEENIRMYSALFGLNRRQTHECVQSAIEFADLGDFIRMPVRSYSSGMQARLAMAAAVSLSAPIILIDEVLAVGDAAFREKSLSRLADLRRAGHTIIIVSHELESIEHLCDRVLVLMEGSIAYEGEPGEAIWYYLQKIRQQQALERRTTVEGEAIGEEHPVVEILGAETLDEEGAPKQVFRSGDTLILRIRYIAHKPIESFVFQVQIWAYTAWNKEPVLVSGTNSEWGGWKPERLDGPGAITVRYENLPLLSGEYAFRVAVLPSLFSRFPFDVCPNIAHFTVESCRKEGGGLIRIPHTWHGGQFQPGQAVPIPQAMLPG
jgi:ABC-type polysaccharide/polyol phosphate transport system ATPase subunit